MKLVSDMEASAKKDMNLTSDMEASAKKHMGHGSLSHEPDLGHGSLSRKGREPDLGHGSEEPAKTVSGGHASDAARDGRFCGGSLPCRDEKLH